MKKKMLKTTFIAIGMFVIFGTGVYAGALLEPISAYLNKGITLTYNGVAFYPQEEDGTRVYPITYNGRTYVPAKFIAEKAGLTVGWNGNTSTVSFTTPDYVAPEVQPGVYKVIGEGTIKFLIDDLTEVVNMGYNVYETKALTQAGTHNIKIECPIGTASERKQIHIKYLDNMKNLSSAKGWGLTSSEDLGDGHYKYTYLHSTQPLKVEMYSTDVALILNASRTDMEVSTIVNPVVSSSFEGVFSIVPKPNLDSSWKEEINTPLKDWTVGKNEAYTMSVDFIANASSKVDPKFEEYKNLLISNGFVLYDVKLNHYTYTKGDVAVKIFNGFDKIIVSLSSGYQAPHVN